MCHNGTLHKGDNAMRNLIFLLCLALVGCGTNYSTLGNITPSQFPFVPETTYCNASPDAEFCGCLHKMYSYACNKVINQRDMTQFVSCLAEENETMNQNNCNDL
jgi:hypothetical protein